MTTHFKAAALFAVAALVLAMPLVAQTTDANPQSNTNSATAGLYKTNVDKATHVHDFTDVSIDKWAGFIGYDNVGTPIGLGFAKNLNSAFLGTWYTGNIAQKTKVWDESTTTAYDLTNQVKDSTTITTKYTTDETRSRNHIAALIGVNGMGFKIGFTESVTTRATPNADPVTNPLTVTVTKNRDGTVTHTTGDIDEYSYVSGSLTPSLNWGTKLALGESTTLKPRAGVSFGIGLNSSTNNYRTTPYTTINDKVIGQKSMSLNGSESGYIYPVIAIGSDIVLEKFTLALDYGIGLQAYNNSYDVAGFTGDVKGTVNWNGSSTTTDTSTATTVTNKTANLTINEYESIPVNHRIALAFTTKKEVVENLNLGLRVRAIFSIYNYTYDSYTLNQVKAETKNNNSALSASNTRTETTTTTYGATNDYTGFSLTPNISVGTTYALFPNRFTINAGIGLTPAYYTSNITRTSNQPRTITKTKTYNGKGDKVTDTVSVTNGNATTDAITVNNTWQYLSAALYTGFLFNFTDNLALDAYFGAAGSSNFNLDTTSFNVLFSVKF